jgi:LEA14-like dessication related protein
MPRLILLTTISFMLLSGCMSYDDVVYQGVENVKIGKPKDGFTTISLNIKLDNPNKYNIKIKPSDVTVFLGGKELGDFHLKETVVIKKHSMDSYPIQLDAKIRDLAKSSLGGMIELMTKKNVTLRFKGFVRVSVKGVTQKRYIDQSKEIETNQFLKLIGL